VDVVDAIGQEELVIEGRPNHRTDRQPSQPAPRTTSVAAGATGATCAHRRQRRSSLA
jgi:hypothetical protein